MRREITGYSIRSREASGTGFMFLLILILPFLAGLVVLGPSGMLQLAGPVLDSVLQQVGAPSTVASARTDTTAPAVSAPIRLPAASWEVRDGHFFTQTNGQPSLTSPTGFLVSNAEGVPFWNEFRRLGGESRIGYPLSQRFAWRGATVQLFQRGMMHWNGESVQMVNIMDELTAAGHDSWLATTKFIPRSVAADFGSPGDPMVARLGLLGSSPALERYFQSTPEALTVYGLPTSAPVSMNEYVTTLRTQRGALHQWKQEGPWGKAGDVTPANSGEIALEAGLFQNAAILPEAPPAS